MLSGQLADADARLEAGEDEAGSPARGGRKGRKANAAAARVDGEARRGDDGVSDLAGHARPGRDRKRGAHCARAQQLS